MIKSNSNLFDGKASPSKQWYSGTACMYKIN